VTGGEDASSIKLTEGADMSVANRRETTKPSLQRPGTLTWDASFRNRSTRSINTKYEISVEKQCSSSTDRNLNRIRSDKIGLDTERKVVDAEGNDEVEGFETPIQ
jgi:hypothetical protein